MSHITGWGNRIFTPSTSLLGRGGENSIAPPRALSLGLFLLLVIHGSNPAGAAVTSRALDSSATLTEVADSSELLYTGVSRGGCIQQLSRMRYPWTRKDLDKLG